MALGVRRGVLDDVLRTHWWALLARGVVAVLFGLFAILWPGITLAVLVVLFGLYALVDGVVAIVGAFATKRWWPLLLIGLVGIATGIVTFAYPGLTALTLYFIIATWALIIGIVQVISAFAEPSEGRSRWSLGISGALAILFGLLMYSAPGLGLLAIVYMIAFYAIFFGITLIWFSIEMRQVGAGVRGALQH